MGIAAAQRLATASSCGVPFQRTRITSRSFDCCGYVRFAKVSTASGPRLGLSFVARASEEDESNGGSNNSRSSEEDDDHSSEEKAASESTKGFGFFRRIWRLRGEPDPEPDDDADEQAEYEENVEELDSSGGLRGLWRWITRKNGEVDRDADVSELEDLDIKWEDLLEPTLDNALALALTGLLGLAVLQITWQLLLVAVAIIISGLKYTVLATFLIAFIIFFL